MSPPPLWPILLLSKMRRGKILGWPMLPTCSVPLLRWLVGLVIRWGVGAVVKIYGMVVGPLVAQEASSRFHQCSHFYIWLVILVTMGNCLLDALLYRYDIR